MITTDNGFKKIEGTDHWNLIFGAHNDSADAADVGLSAIKSGIAVLANGDTHPAIGLGWFVYVRNHSVLPEGLYTATATIAENAALSDGNLETISGGGFNEILRRIDDATPYTGGTVIEAGQDLNNFVATGKYYIGSLTVARSTTNIPVELNGRLDVIRIPGTGRVRQEYTVNNSTDVYVRIYGNSAWTAWDKIVTMSGAVKNVRMINKAAALSFNLSVPTGSQHILMLTSNHANYYYVGFVFTTTTTTTAVEIAKGSGITVTSGNNGTLTISFAGETGRYLNVVDICTNWTSDADFVI